MTGNFFWLRATRTLNAPFLDLVHLLIALAPLKLKPCRKLRCQPTDLRKMPIQECIPVGCVPSAAVAVGGGVSSPGTPPDHAPPGPCTSRTMHTPGTMHTTRPDHAPPCGQTQACKHITLPQTSFAGGKNLGPK